MNDAFDKNVIINVFKPEGITSQGVVTAVKRALGVKTAGHCGTLDPLATGVLPVMITHLLPLCNLSFRKTSPFPGHFGEFSPTTFTLYKFFLQKPI